MAIELGVAALAGVISHLAIFIRGEWHIKAPGVLNAYVLLFISIMALQWISGSARFSQVLFTSSLVATSYLVALFSSIATYRLLFHRLRAVNGPVLARVSKLWHVAHVLDSKNHVFLTRLQKKYGDVVRTGPSEVTIFSAEVLAAIDGPGNHCTKAAWYDALLPESLVNTSRDKATHSQRRRLWDVAFTPKALAGYNERMLQYAQRLERSIAASQGRVIDASSMLYEFSFDLMGAFAFDRPAAENETAKQKWHTALAGLHKGMSLLGPLSPVPWLLHIGLRVSWIPIVHNWNAMIDFCKRCMDERIKLSHQSSDISYWLMSAHEKSNIDDRLKRHWLYGDAITMVIAGSDTVALTLVFLFYHIASHPDQADALRKELATVAYSLDVPTLLALPRLNAFIHETLRLFPTTPTGGYRDSPPEGLTVSGQYIPSGTTIVAPAYTIGRLPTYFQHPNDFIPDRWLHRKDLVLNKRAFTPFKQGRHACVGRKLAMAELSVVLALLVPRYSIRFAPGDDGSSVVRDMRDCFTAKPGRLRLVFEPIDMLR